MPSDPKHLFPESEFLFVPDVAIFKTHERVKNGKKIKITKKELEQIAANHTAKFQKLGIALPSSEGHTLDKADGDDVPEKDQPDITGWFVNYRVAKLPSDPDEDYLIADWYVRRDKSYVIRDYPTRSVELYPSKMELWPVANLKSSCPELDLPIIRYTQEKRPDEDPIQLTLTSPLTYSSERQPMEKCETDKKDEKKAYESEDKKPDAKKDKSEEAAFGAAEAKETKGAKQDASDLQQVMAMLQPLQELVPAIPKLLQLVQMLDEEGDGDDLMATDKGADDVDDEPSPDTGKGDPKPGEKDMAKDTEKPVDFSSTSSATNAFIPSTTKKETYMASDEVTKYKADLEKAQAELARIRTEQEATAKIAKDLYRAKRKTDAEAQVAEIEKVCKYRSEKARQEDLDMLQKLDEDSAKQYVKMALERYERKLPDSAGVKEVARYAVEGEPDLNPKTAEEAHERAMKILASGLTRDEYLKQMVAGAKK